MLDQFVDRSAGPDACWPWTGGSFVRGYGVFYTLGTLKTRRMIKAHRLVFELANDGACPPVVDHMCHDNAECDLGEHCPHRRCCNPGHLGASTLGENLTRALAGIYQEECSAGHRMSGDNAYEAPDGSRHCRPCAAANARAARRMAAPRRQVIPSRRRPRGQSRQEAVEWALDGQDPDACMYWPGITPGKHGYVSVRVEGRETSASRLVYTVKIKPIPAGHVVDHTCHKPAECSGGLDCPHRQCINPAHFAAVTNAANTGAARSSRKRPGACWQGHEFTEANTFVDKRGSRYCLACKTLRQQADRAKAKAAPGWADGRRRVGDVCPNGHDVTVTGLDKLGKCAECDRVWHREDGAARRAVAKAGSR